VEQEQTWELLNWPSKAVNLLRDALASANVEPPVWLVQLVVLLVAIVLIYLFLRLLKTKGNLIARGANGVAIIVAGGILLGIVWTWIDYALNPLNGQITGTIRGVEPGQVQIQLLDYRDRGLGVVDLISGSDRFVASYQPFFADPPTSILAEAQGCEAERQALTRRHLQFGTPVSISLTCSDG
jgi:hypothetical protein